MAKYKTIIAEIFLTVLLFSFAYLLVFGRAIKQEENHIGIAFALPQIMLGKNAVRIDEENYLSKDTKHFIEAMEEQGFTHIEQMGAGHFFEKEGKRYLSTSRMYSSHFMLFTIPEPIL